MSGTRGAGAVEAALLPFARAMRGVRTLRRPATEHGPAFDLAYVRVRSADAQPGVPPVVIIPGGPGLASVLPYGTQRSLARRGGLDLIMVEHRGVGLSRRDTSGRDLPQSAMRIPEVVGDLAEVLDAEGVPSAFIAGSSYGSYLAAAFGATYPQRVAGMLLDSTLQSASHLDLERRAIREVFWEGDHERAELVRGITASGHDQRVLLDVIRAAYELGGDRLLLPLLRSQLRNPRALAWRALEQYALRDGSISRIPGIYEFDIVGALAFRELGYGGTPDGLPLDPALTYAPLAGHFPAFAGEPYDLDAAVPHFDWPLVLLSGDRDLRTPRAIAERVAQRAPDAALVKLRLGHSALETHPLVFLNAVRWLIAGKHRQLPAAAERLDRLPLRGLAARLPNALARIIR